MNKISAVYKIVNTVTNECYVGSSKNVKDRWHEHKCLYKQKRHPNNQMYKDMQELGIDKFRFQILAPVEPEHLKEVEQEFIDILHPTYNSNRANGWNVERIKDYQKEYYKEYRQSDKSKERQIKYHNQLCSYNGEILTLGALATRFHRAGVEHPAIEAKKYLKKDSNN
jgi:group I intron endonuclease